jgi:hypothetical protein
MTSAITHPTTRKAFAVRKLVWVGPLSIIVAAIANLAIRGIATSFFGVSQGFAYFQAYYIVGSTVVYLALALLAFVLVGRVARQPVPAYRLLALGALAVSFLSPLMALARLFPVAGMTLPIFWTMIAMHTVTAVLTVGLLTTLAVTPTQDTQTASGKW